MPAGSGAVTDIVVGNPLLGRQAALITPSVLNTVPPLPGDLTAGSLPGGASVGPNATFTHDELFSDTSWTGVISSVISAPTSQFNSQAGRCFLVLGELTPTSVEGTVTSGFDTPGIGVLIDGRFFSASGGRCDAQNAENQGFDWILEAEVTLGTEYQFYTEVFIPDAIEGSPKRVVVGRESDSAATFRN